MRRAALTLQDQAVTTVLSCRERSNKGLGGREGGEEAPQGDGKEPVAAVAGHV